MSFEILKGPLRILGRLTCDALDIPAETVDDAAVKSTADIGAHKLRHQHSLPVAIGKSDDTAAAGTHVVHTAFAAGTAHSFKIGLVSPCTVDATVTVDLQVNGASILSSTVELSASQSTRELVEATIAPAKTLLTADDVVDIVVAVNAAAGVIGAGLFGLLVTREKAG